MISVRNVVYDYASSRALHGVSFDVQRGTVLAMVGPNGAGKTTLLRCMAALDLPGEGTIGIDGLDTRENPRGVHEAIGYLPDFFGLYDELTVRQSLIYAARARGVSVAKTDTAVAAAASRVQLNDRMDQRAGELSRGLRQRLAIAQSIVHAPRVLLLDEPAAGLDPEARLSLSGLISGLAAEGMTIVVSSHILAELEDYSTQMLMIREGRVASGGIIAADEPAGVKVRVRVEFADAVKGLPKRLGGLGLDADAIGADEALIIVDAGAEHEALAALIGDGLKVRSFAPERRTLEAAYLAEVRRAGEAAQ